ncbi:MAG TPA: DUF222 domain-containing protein [Acidimicrobiales bacterium]|nr:DUF222 domain-containing protein [Acidimicrobiales bacterium]
MTPAQAGDVVRLCAQIEASAASIKALAAARSAEGSEWERCGYRSPAEQLADQAGMSPGAAKRALETGRRMADQPEVAQAALAGELSLEQAAAVSDGVAANPARARDLIDKAKRSSLPELAEEVARVKADSSDREERRQARHAKRSFRRWTDLDGALGARIYGHPEDGALLWRMLDPIRRRLNVLRRDAGSPNESLDALDYDALMIMAAAAVGRDGELSLADLVQLGLFPQLDPLGVPGRSRPVVDRPGGVPDLFADAGSLSTDRAYEGAAPPVNGGGRVKKLAGSPLRVMIRVDLDSLLRGVPLEGELCEIAGYGPVPVSVIEDLLATENPFIIGLLTKGEALVGVYHHGRHPNAYQRSALDFLHPTCAVEGCSSRAGLQYDHREDFARTRITAFDLLDRLCRHHHSRKTREGWALVDGRGKRPFVPPDDPRHPRFGASPPGHGP